MQFPLQIVAKATPGPQTGPNSGGVGLANARINLRELTTLRMELGAHGGPGMKVTNIQKSNLSKSFFQKVWMEQIFQN